MTVSPFVLRPRRALVAALAVLAVASCDSPSGSGARAPAAMALVSGDLQHDTVGQQLPAPLVVRVVDDTGQPVPNAVVNFVVAAGGGSVFAGAAQTNANGLAQELWTLGMVAGDTQRVEVRAVDPATGQPKVYAVFRAIGVPAPPSRTEAFGSTKRYGARGTVVPDSLAVRVLDAYGNLAPGVSVSWSATAGGGSVSPATSTTGADGVARAAWTFGPTTASQAAAGVVAGVQPRTFEGEVLTPANAAIQPISFPTFAPPGSTIQVRFRVVRALTQPVVVRPGIAVTLTTEGGASVTPSAVTTDAAGEATVQWTLSGAVGPQALTATAGEVVFRFTTQAYTPGDPYRLSVRSLMEGSWAYAGTKVLLSAEVYDQARKPMQGVTVSWMLSPGGGTFDRNSSVTNAAGEAETVWNVGTTAGRAQLTVSVPGLTQSGPIDIRPAGAVRLEADPQSVSIVAGATARVVIRAYDRYGNVMDGARPQTVVVGDLAVVEVYRQIQPSGMLVPYDFVARTAGSTEVTFTSPGLQGDTVSVTVTPAP